MKGPYLGLAVAVVVLAFGLTAIGRPRKPERPAAAAAPIPVVTLALVIDGDHLTPATSSVPMGVRVQLHVEAKGPHAATLALAGYEDRLTLPPLAPGESWSGEFLADRPGEDFAWVLNGVPAGRLAVLGSHLIEGHR